MRTRYKVIYADRPGTKARPHSATSKSEACMIAERAVAGRRKPPRVVIKDTRGRKVSCDRAGQLRLGDSLSDKYPPLHRHKLYHARAFGYDAPVWVTGVRQLPAGGGEIINVTVARNYGKWKEGDTFSIRRNYLIAK